MKVLQQEGQVRQKKVKYDSLLPGEDDPVNESGILVHEKRTRFSLSHDQDSIGWFSVTYAVLLFSYRYGMFVYHRQPLLCVLNIYAVAYY